MITIDNLRTVLEHYGFTKETVAKYSKSFGTTLSCQIIVDFQDKKITYPEGLDTGDNTTTNFSHNENFVVLECVIKLLLQGYSPDTIYLEKAWTLGHTAKSGRADITVYKNFKNGNDENSSDNFLPYLIIECKTAGAEYKNAQKELFDDPDGKQLFSYFCQARSVEWLQLYASDLDNDGNVVMYEEVIKTKDDENVLDAYKLDNTILTFDKASEAKDAFLAWEDTYAKESWKNRGLVFGDDAKAYNIGIRPKKRKDLIDLKDKDDTKGVVDKFREILRHNSISDKENAFNKLLSLFICKFVDEDTHQNENDVMDFQYVEGTDNYYSLYEKLLNLFNKGMDEYLKEKVFYLGQDYIGKTLQQYAKKKRKNLQEELEISFQKTKMLSCQVFAFKEVYNEKLFAQNGKILVEMVKLLQDYSFSGTGDKQLLGDLFENLLNQGFKQEAGQFFTPIPITRFIWNSLPIEKYIKENGYKVPKTIDFACGSGHFLTEGISAVKDAFKSLGLEKTDADVSNEFYGTEKDNRLARVSKVALLFNGATKAKIFAVDGLEHVESDLGRLNSFDILVANPPYSVDEFKKHVSRKVQKSYETIQLMSTQCGDIQNVFSERMQYLLNSRGLASIILPSSYLNTKNEADILTRDLLVKNFYIKAIANFNDKTFGETNTTTVVLFLERRNLDIKEAKISKDSVDAILNLEDLAGWVDDVIFSEYLSAIKTEKDSYINFWTEKADVLDADKFSGYFKEYRDYYVLKNAKDLDKIETTKQLEAEGKMKKNQKTTAELIASFNKAFYGYVKRTEEDKILILSLTYNQKTLILNAPKDNTEQEKFLGYTFSKRRGDEGIKETEGYLANKNNRNDADKIAYILRESITGNFINSEKYGKYINVVKTSDMFTFANPVFDKAIKTVVEQTIVLNFKYKMLPLGSVVETLGGLWTGENPPLRTVAVLRNTNFTMRGTIDLSDVAMIDVEENSFAKRKLQKGDIIIEKSGGSATQAVGRVVIFNHEGDFAYSNFTNRIRVTNDNVNPFYLHNYLHYLYLLGYTFQYQSGTSGLKNLNIPEYLTIKVPLPPLDVQSQIVSECEAIDAEYNTNKDNIAKWKNEIEEIVNGVEGERTTVKKVLPYAKDKIDFTDINPDTYVTTDNLLQNCEGMIVYDKTPNIDKVVKYNVGDILVSNIRPYLKKIWFADKDGGCSPDVLVFTNADKSKYNSQYLYYLLKQDKFFNFIMEGVKGMKMPRGDKDQIQNFPLIAPSLPEQEKIVSKIEVLETKISQARISMAQVNDRKKAVLDKYLK